MRDCDLYIHIVLARTSENALKIEADPWIKWSVIPRSVIAPDASQGTRIVDHRSRSDHGTMMATHEFVNSAMCRILIESAARSCDEDLVASTFAQVCPWNFRRVGSMSRTMLRTTTTSLCVTRHRVSRNICVYSSSKSIYFTTNNLKETFVGTRLVVYL